MVRWDGLVFFEIAGKCSLTLIYLLPRMDTFTKTDSVMGHVNSQSLETRVGDSFGSCESTNPFEVTSAFGEM